MSKLAPCGAVECDGCGDCDDVPDDDMTCPQCGGTGTFWDFPCDKCEGQGRLD